MSEAPPAAQSPRPCPICAKPRSERYRPFCSRRCADVDLGRWLGGNYAIPANEEGQEEMPEAERGEGT